MGKYRISGSKGNTLGSFFSKMPIHWILIIFNIIIFILWIIFRNFYPSLDSYLILTPNILIEKGYFWTLFTHMFLHAGAFHLLVNMFTLFFLGSITENIVGRKRFLGFYLVAGVFAGIVFVLFSLLGTKTGLTSVFGGVDLGGVGASGALFGLIGILALIIPRKKVYLVVGPLIVIILQIILTPFIPQGAVNFVDIVFTLILFFMIFAMFIPNRKLNKFAIPLEMAMWMAPVIAIVPLVLISFFVDLPIANTAHFGGLVAGVIYGIYLRVKYKRKVKMLERFFR